MIVKWQNNRPVYNAYPLFSRCYFGEKIIREVLQQLNFCCHHTTLMRSIIMMCRM